MYDVALRPDGQKLYVAAGGKILVSFVTINPSMAISAKLTKLTTLPLYVCLHCKFSWTIPEILFNVILYCVSIALSCIYWCI